jgi:hypothetical protein
VRGARRVMYGSRCRLPGMGSEHEFFDWPKAIAWLLMLAAGTAVWGLVAIALLHTVGHV